MFKVNHKNIRMASEFGLIIHIFAFVKVSKLELKNYWHKNIRMASEFGLIIQIFAFVKVSKLELKNYWHTPINLEITFWNCLSRFPVYIYLFKVNNRNTRKRCVIRSQLTIKTPDTVSDAVLLFLLLTLNIFHIFFYF